MCYRVAVRPDGRDEVVVQVDPKNFLVEEHYEGGVAVEVEYAKAKLAQHDSEGYQAILGAWPTVDELVLYRRGERVEDSTEYEWEEVFAGSVTKVDTDDHEVTIAGHMKDEGPGEPPNPLTVDVQEDTDDATRMSVIVRTDNDGEGEVRVDYGNGTEPVTNPGDGASGSQYQYPAAGTYTVTATDADDGGRQAIQVVTVPYGA